MNRQFKQNLQRIVKKNWLCSWIMHNVVAFQRKLIKIRFETICMHIAYIRFENPKWISDIFNENLIGSMHGSLAGMNFSFLLNKLKFPFNIEFQWNRSKRNYWLCYAHFRALNYSFIYSLQRFLITWFLIYIFSWNSFSFSSERSQLFSVPFPSSIWGSIMKNGAIIYYVWTHQTCNNCLAHDNNNRRRIIVK